ncbi:hypothetical protein THRCLA_04894 [Thraustotheca clavata]|uniref:Probable pectate lyase F n=1 Tax=Thraustotheca clavata TaxID=74557 RepID=A0A1V9ZXM2_9STRA|nr:hypothetical protein THRCLA_04894 [Thraustotheca clavata]
MTDLRQLLEHLKGIEGGKDTNDRLIKRFKTLGNDGMQVEDTLSKIKPNQIYSILQKDKRKRRLPRQKQTVEENVESLTNRRERLHVQMSFQLNRQSNISILPMPAAPILHPKRELNSKLQKSLDIEQKKEVGQVRAAENDVKTALHDAETLLPLSFLMEHNLTALCQSKAGSIIKTAFQTFLLHFYADAWHHWIEFIAQSRAADRKAAAIVINRVYRGHRARIACKLLREQLNLLQISKKQVLLNRIEQRNKCAMTIQMCFRQFQLYQRHCKVLERDGAARVIQKLVKYHKTRAIHFAEMLADARRQFNANTIQRVYRGYRGRCQSKQAQLTAKRLQIIKKLCDPELAIANRFESYGAAFRIQSCVRRWLARRHGRQLRQKIRRQRAAKLLLKIMHSYSVYRQYKRHQQKLLVQYPQRRKAALIIQRNIQKWIGVRKWQLQRIVRRKEMRLKRVAEYERKRRQPLAKVTHGVVKAKQRFQAAFATLLSTNSNSTNKYIDARSNAAVIIQRAFRCSRLRYKKYLKELYAQIEFILLRKSALFKYAQVIQRIWRGRRARKQIKFLWLEKVTRNAIAKWKARRIRRQNIAATKIQQKVRSLKGRRMAKIALANMIVAKKCAIQIQRLIRPWLARNMVHRQREMIRLEHEVYLYCVATLEMCVIHAMEFLVLQSLEGTIGDAFVYPSCLSTKSYIKHTASFPFFQLVFLDYYGLKRDHLGTMPLKELAGLRLDRSKFLKIFREIFPNSTKQMDISSNADKVLAKLKEHPNQSRVALSYSMFTKAVKDMAILQIKPKSTDLPADDKLLLLVFKHMKTAKWANKFQGYNELQQCANLWLNSAAACIQRLARRQRNKLRGQALLHIKRIERQQNILTDAASVIQRAWRMRDSRKSLRLLMKAVFRKYIDAETGLPYWTNPRTGYSTWKKPLILGKEDVDSGAIYMATKDFEYSILCTNCNVHLIQESCFHCEEMYCKTCFKSLHTKGKMLTHLHFPIEGCSLCKFQVGTQSCTQCEAAYCDNCMLQVHKKGNLAFHTSTPLVPLCNNCNQTRAVRVHCLTHECSLCFACAHDHPPELCQTQDIPFMPFSLANEMKRVQMERKELLVAEQKRMEDERELKAKQLQSAIRIQRNWRRKEVHQQGFQKLLTLAKAKQEEWKKLQRDKKKQHTVSYALKDIFGKADFLETDSPVHQVLRRLNVITRHKILARVRKLQVPLDEYIFKGVLLPGHATITKNTTLLETSEDIRGWVINGQALRLNDHIYYIHVSEVMMDTTIRLHKAFEEESVKNIPFYAVEFSCKFPTNLAALYKLKHNSLINVFNRDIEKKKLLPRLKAAIPEAHIVDAMVKLGTGVQSLANRVDEDSLLGKSLSKMAKSVTISAHKKKIALNEKLEKANQQLAQDKTNERRRNTLRQLSNQSFVIQSSNALPFESLNGDTTLPLESNSNTQLLGENPTENLSAPKSNYVPEQSSIEYDTLVVNDSVDNYGYPNAQENYYSDLGTNYQYGNEYSTAQENYPTPQEDFSAYSHPQETYYNDTGISSDANIQFGHEYSALNHQQTYEDWQTTSDQTFYEAPNDYSQAIVQEQEIPVQNYGIEQSGAAVDGYTLDQTYNNYDNYTGEWNTQEPVEYAQFTSTDFNTTDAYNIYSYDTTPASTWDTNYSYDYTNMTYEDQYNVNSNYTQEDSQAVQDEQNVWQEIYDPQSGNNYYYNTATGESVWQ